MHIHILFIALYNLCSFVCLEFIVPLENFSLIWRRHHYRWVATKFDLCSVLMAIKQWGFFSVTHLLLWHGASVYDGHLQGPLTHLHRRAFRSAAVTTCFNDYGISRLGFEHPTFLLWDYPPRHPRGQCNVCAKFLVTPSANIIIEKLIRWCRLECSICMGIVGWSNPCRDRCWYIYWVFWGNLSYRYPERQKAWHALEPNYTIAVTAQHNF